LEEKGLKILIKYLTLIKYYLKMILGTIFLIILYLILKYIIAWIIYYNNLDSRLGDSTWRFSYDYPVVGERDISDLDDKDFVRLRRKKNKIVLLMYSIVLIMFISSMSLLSKFLLFFFD
jgi:hypothetical protein|tara:strand:- start:1751 stop:2107 length:357 start_codon:yes stop_codon:yes gene_type:complete